MSIERNYTLAKLIRRRCSNDKKRISHLTVHIAKIEQSAAAGEQRILPKYAAKTMVKLADNLKSTDFDEFEKIRFVGATFLSNARESLEKARPICQKAIKGGGASITTQELSSIKTAYTRVKDHLQRLDNHAKDYLNKWDTD